MSIKKIEKEKIYEEMKQSCLRYIDEKNKTSKTIVKRNKS